ncbi:hypothetical protein L1987_10087 [Smallanthus sonchifolius]|uniref:Uncharacterized protein n=1 Tax=Smallanthus sonchifolius TaxID=185202 RepID=A0ACB9JRB1_9ASTR|nr:hypothetical protein L1987_10087 [Smallanthus sonchifolius]
MDFKALKWQILRGERQVMEEKFNNGFCFIFGATAGRPEVMLQSQKNAYNNDDGFRNVSRGRTRSTFKDLYLMDKNLYIRSSSLSLIPKTSRTVSLISATLSFSICN